MKVAVRRFLDSIGPGVITAALVFGPGSLTVNIKLGSEFGLALFWLIPVAICFMIIFTGMAARVGLRLKESPMEAIRQRWGKLVYYVNGIGIFFVALAFQAGNSIGSGMAFAELFQTSLALWAGFFALLAIGLLWFRSFYKLLEKAMILLVLLMLTAFLTTTTTLNIPVETFFAGLVPGFPDGSETLSVALAASSFSVIGAFHQAYLSREKAHGQGGTRSTNPAAGIIILGIMSCLVMSCAAGVLHQKGIEIKSPADLGLSLEPLAGKSAKNIFMVGLFGASFSSLLGNATLGGTFLADVLNLGSDLTRVKVRMVIAGIILAGAAIAMIFNHIPIRLIIFAQAITVFIAPLVGISLFLLANDKKLMGASRNKPYQNLFALGGILVLVFLSWMNLQKLI